MNRRELLGSVGAVALLPARAALAAVLPAQPVAGFEATLHLGPIRDAAGKRRGAQVIGGKVSGARLRGVVRSGSVQWLVDPASGAVELQMDCKVLSDAGNWVTLRDRTVHAGSDGLRGMTGLVTAPALHAADSGLRLHATPLAGRLDGSGLSRGVMLLRAFEVC